MRTSPSGRCGSPDVDDAVAGGDVRKLDGGGEMTIGPAVWVDEAVVGRIEGSGACVHAKDMRIAMAARATLRITMIHS
jgi:hypothetical protein